MSGAPEADIINELMDFTDLTFQEYELLKKENEPFFKLYEIVHDYMSPDVEEIYMIEDDGYRFKLSLEPRNPAFFGFKVTYQNGKFTLLQNLDPIDLMDVPELDFIENDEGLSEREVYEAGVGSTTSINALADFLCKMADHYQEADACIVPLSLSTYMKVNSFVPFAYKVHFKDDDIKSLQTILLFVLPSF